MEKMNGITTNIMDQDKMIINLPHHHHHHHQKQMVAKFSHKNLKKPFKMSYRRLLSIIFITLTIINIISMVIYTSIYLNKIDKKEHLEKHDYLISQRTNPTNRDAYSIVRFINFTAMIANIVVRIFGLIAIGVCGREYSYTEFESSDRRESFTGCLAYTCAMIILLAAYYVGIVRLITHDLLIHCVLTILGGIFIAFSLQHTDTYSKELNILSI